jgi:hypothetical protein
MEVILVVEHTHLRSGVRQLVAGAAFFLDLLSDLEL